LLTLGRVRDPLPDQIRALASEESRFVTLASDLARQNRLYLVAGTIPHLNPDGRLNNVSHVFGPDGRHGSQAKLHMTRFEREWRVEAGSGLRVFETSFGLMAVAICYDVEVPELVRGAARAGARVLDVPS
jgi:predicted amidohydrolase